MSSSLIDLMLVPRVLRTVKTSLRISRSFRISDSVSRLCAFSSR